MLSTAREARGASRSQSADRAAEEGRLAKGKKSESQKTASGFEVFRAEKITGREGHVTEKGRFSWAL